MFFSKLLKITSIYIIITIYCESKKLNLFIRTVNIKTVEQEKYILNVLFFLKL